MKSFIAATTALSFLSTVHAQYAVDPNSVDSGTRQAWCQQQISQCPLICLQTPSVGSSSTESNTCDWHSLTYACVCSNGLSPNVSEYSQTLPYYICQEWGSQCVANCGLADNDCASACRQDHPCGAQNPTRQNSTSSASGSSSPTSAASGSATGTASGSAAGGVVYTGFAQPSGSAGSGAGNGPAVAQKNAGARVVRVWALGVGQTFGTLGLVGAFVGGMALFL